VASFYQDNSVFQNSITIMAVLSRLLSYCCIQRDQEPSFTDKSLSKAGLADEIVAKLFAAQKNDAILQADLQSIIHAYGWYDGLAAAILAGLEKAIKLGEEMGPAMKAAYEKTVAAVNKVKEWAEAHPEMTAVIITLIALGVLALMIPWLMASLGFAEEGIIEGKFVTLLL
jgi:hypothetical protein